jgi:hypothetical protein
MEKRAFALKKTVTVMLKCVWRLQSVSTRISMFEMQHGKGFQLLKCSKKL